MSLLDKLKKNSTIASASVLDESIIYGESDTVQTQIPMLNVAFSGSLTGGLTSGITLFAGPSRHFKSLFALVTAKAYMDKYPDAVMLFYDNEFGMPKDYFTNLQIDPKRVLHSPILDIEQLKHDVMNQLTDLKRGDRVVVVIDSIGNIASKKEVDDTLEGKTVADMTRAKQIKSLFRMCTPHLTMKDLPMIVVNHTYNTMEMYSKPVVSGGTGIVYSSNNIFIIGRQQEKDGDEHTGYRFIINVEKSRFSREKSKIPIEVSFDKGISRWSGLIDVALESGHVVKPSNGWYQKKDDIKKYRKDDTNNEAFWASILDDPTFEAWIKDNYAISSHALMDHDILSDDEIEEEYEKPINWRTPD